MARSHRIAPLVSALLIAVAPACPSGDLGAPCNHGSIEPPESKLVTFPSLICGDDLCIYADDAKAPTSPCTTDDECNAASPDEDRFACVDQRCELSLNYVLTRSMCSKRCESDADCADGGPLDAVLAEESACRGGFRCVVLQQLGRFCCEPLCVCTDDISEATVEKLGAECADGTIQCDAEL